MRGVPPKISLPREVFKIPEKELKKIEKSFTIEKIGNEMAYCVKMKGKGFLQLETSFKLQKLLKKIESRFGEKFKKAWQEALKIVKAYDKGVLLSQRYFYEVVYKPRFELSFFYHHSPALNFLNLFYFKN